MTNFSSSVPVKETIQKKGTHVKKKIIPELEKPDREDHFLAGPKHNFNSGKNIFLGYNLCNMAV